MPDLLLELLSEEIPARMQARAADDLKRLVTGALMEAGFLFEAAQAFATPRRLALHVVGLPARGKDLREERKGPRVGAPDAAVQGFVKSAGVASVADLTVQTDPKKGDFYVAVVERAGRATPDVVAEILPGILRSFPWPKSMRWGRAEPGSLRWVRPLQSILCTFGTDVETPEIVAFEVDGIASGDTTRGHRFLAPEFFRARRFDDYVAGLDAHKVILDPARRRDVIRHDARDLAFAQGLEVVEDEALLEEVAGLVEWPVVLMGTFDPAFLAVPDEAIRATIRANQKCFVLREPGGRLANRFLLTANIEASDGGVAIVAGNERVVRARLSDARFFWEQDLKAPLESRLAKLDSIVFHEKLGTQGQRVARIATLARELAAVTGADPDRAERAARLAKADLTTEMVGEFPELQGLMGRYYAAAQGEDPSVATAIEDHYRPLGPTDRVPTDPVAVTVALADKLDTLVGFWMNDEKPTGSKDPFALRRAALGVIRLVLENGLRIPLNPAIERAWSGHAQQDGFTQRPARFGPDLLAFFQDRLKVYLRDRGARHDLIDAVLSANSTQPPHAEVAGAAGPRSTQDRGASFEATLRSAPQDDGVGGAAAGRRADVLSANSTLPPHAEVAGEAGPRSTQGGGAIPAHGGGASPDPVRGKLFEAPLRSAPQDEAVGSSGPGARVEEVRGTPANDDLLAVVRRVEALGAFLDTEDGANLLAGTKRAANILRIEEKKDGRSYGGASEEAALVLPEERALATALAAASGEASSAISREDYAAAMTALARLRPAVDAFFDRVTVNDPDPALRRNRLTLLAGLRDATRAVADFAKVEG